MHLLPLRDGWLMHRRWTWLERRRKIRWIATACWSAYLATVLITVALVLPRSTTYYPGLFASLVVLAVGPPAWIHYNWIFNPAYLFGSNGIRRIRFTEQVQSQVSLKNNVGNAFGVPLVPLDLRTPLSRVAGGGGERSGADFTLIRVVWDDYLYIPGCALFPGLAVPKRTLPAILDFGSDGLILSVGRWRPGVVFELPYSRIVGVWNGSQIKTIDSGGVLVVVVDSGDDELLFPFEVVRVAPKQSPRVAVEEMIGIIEQRRQNW